MENKKKVVVSGSVVAAAIACCLPFIHSHEGNILKSYPDSVGVWTACSGITKNIKPGMEFTSEQCDDMTKATVTEFMTEVVGMIQVPIAAETLAAHASFAYNIGIEGYKRSTALRLTNADDTKGGCNAMMNWSALTIKKIKYDCRIQQNQINVNGCRGLINRRNEEIKLCLSGVPNVN